MNAAHPISTHVPLTDDNGLISNPFAELHSNDPLYHSFLRRASNAVEERLPDVVDRVRRSEIGKGMWHPTGFATFEVATIPDLGLMRVHFWPIGMRRQLSGHPPIHQHCFQLFSRVLAGEYRESQYVVGKVRTRRALRRYEVRNTGVFGRDQLWDTGVDTSITPTMRSMVFPAGAWHEVEVGTFHATPIPSSRFCATLAVLSIPVPGAHDVLLGSAGFGTTVHARRSVSDEEVAEIVTQFDHLCPS